MSLLVPKCRQKFTWDPDVVTKSIKKQNLTKKFEDLIGVLKCFMNQATIHLASIGEFHPS